jgi:hypothetical protein
MPLGEYVPVRMGMCVCAYVYVRMVCVYVRMGMSMSMPMPHTLTPLYPISGIFYINPPSPYINPPPLSILYYNN